MRRLLKHFIKYFWFYLITLLYTENYDAGIGRHFRALSDHTKRLESVNLFYN